MLSLKNFITFFDIDEKKMDHALRLKIIAKETEELKVLKIEKTKILRDKTNDTEFKRKLETIEFVASTKKKGKEEDVVRKEKARQGKLKIGSEQMGLLHGELRKQVASNGGTVPNPGTTPLPMVSHYITGNYLIISVLTNDFFTLLFPPRWWNNLLPDREKCSSVTRLPNFSRRR